MFRLSVSLFCVGLAFLTLGCSAGGGSSSSNPTPIPVTENQLFDLGLNGDPEFSSGLYSGGLSLEFSYDGKTSTNPAGTLEVGFTRLNDQLTVTYKVFEPGEIAPTLANLFVMEIDGNILSRFGQNVGQIGAFSMIIRDQNWTYKFFRAVSAEDKKTPMLKVTARNESGGQTAVYTGLLKLK